MKKEAFIKIWKDPVWSKIISVFITALFTLAYNFIVSKINGTSFVTSFKYFWTIKVDLWVIFLCVTIFLASYFLLTKRFKYDTDTLTLDRALFNQIRKSYSMTDFILEIKSNGFSSRPIKSDRISTLINVMEDSKKPDFEFINPYLNKLKNKVIKEVENLNTVLSENIYGTNNSEWLSIPSEWEFDQPDRMRKAINDIEKQENILSSTIQEFITKGRNILKV